MVILEDCKRRGFIAHHQFLNCAEGSVTVLLHCVPDVSDNLRRPNDGPAGHHCPGSGTYNGTYTGHASLGANSLAPTNVPTNVNALPQCAGSTAEYAQSMTTSFDGLGAGSVQMTDTPGFPRAYPGTITATGTFMSSGTFPYYGTSVPGWIGMKFAADGKTRTFSETTQWGSCANTYTAMRTKP
jgi:hypothetical protein